MRYLILKLFLVCRTIEVCTPPIYKSTISDFPYYCIIHKSNCIRFLKTSIIPKFYYPLFHTPHQHSRDIYLSLPEDQSSSTSSFTYSQVSFSLYFSKIKDFEKNFQEIHFQPLIFIKEVFHDKILFTYNIKLQLKMLQYYI